MGRSKRHKSRPFRESDHVTFFERLESFRKACPHSRQELLKKRSPHELKMDMLLKAHFDDKPRMFRSYIQHPIHLNDQAWCYPDFLFISKDEQVKIVLEVDGQSHDTRKQREWDERRTRWLGLWGITVHRIWNEEVNDRLYARKFIESALAPLFKTCTCVSCPVHAL